MPRRIATMLLSTEPVTRFEKALYPEVFRDDDDGQSGPRSSSEVGASMHQKVLDKYSDKNVVAKMDLDGGTELVTKGKGTKGIHEKLMRKLKRKDTRKAKKEKYQKMKSKLQKSKKFKLNKLLLPKKKNKLMQKLRSMVKKKKSVVTDKRMSVDIHIDLKGIKARKAKCKINRAT